MHKILVVDDDKFIRKAIIDILDLNLPEVETFEAKNGEVGFQIACQFIPHIIFLDYEMPFMDGFQVAKSIKALPLFIETQIIGISARCPLEERVTKMRKLCDDWLQKPFSQSDILAPVRTKLQSIQVTPFCLEIRRDPS